MNWYEALIFGLVQGLTEFLPVSSDGHLEIVKYIFGGIEESFLFSVAVHGATVLSIIVVFWKEIVKLLQGVFKFRMNEETIYALKIVVSMIPVAVVGFTMKDFVESLFTANMQITGSFLIVTALFLVFGHFVKKRETRRFHRWSFQLWGLRRRWLFCRACRDQDRPFRRDLCSDIKKKSWHGFDFNGDNAYHWS